MCLSIPRVMNWMTILILILAAGLISEKRNTTFVRLPDEAVDVTPIFYLQAFYLDFISVLTLKLFSLSTASGGEFHKISKPRIRPAKSCFTSATTKSSRGSYRDVQSIIHAPQTVRDLEIDGVLISFKLLFLVVIDYHLTKAVIYDQFMEYF